MHSDELDEPRHGRAREARAPGPQLEGAAESARERGGDADERSLASLFAVPTLPAPAALPERAPLAPRGAPAPVVVPALLQRALRAARSLLRARISVAFLAQSLLAFTLVHFLLFNLSVVRGSSMNPGIHDGDRIVIDPWAYVFGAVERGDVVVLKYPLDPHVDYIKRVIGIPGDEVVIEAGRVWVNGQALHEPYVADADPLSRLATRVKPAHYFVLGDNRPRSSDSRDFGQVPAEYVRGRVEVRLWPFERLGAVR